MKVLFLDFDGVICTIRSSAAIKEHGLMTYLDPIALGLIQRVVVEYGYSVVISSSWRHRYKKLEDFRLIFLVAGVQGIADALHPDWCTPKFSNDGHERGYEIRDWLNAHPEVESYLIIDDERDMLTEQMGRFVYVKSSQDGFSYANFAAACELSK